MRKIKGAFCEVTDAPKKTFAPASFRWKALGVAKARGKTRGRRRTWLMTGCRKRHWSKIAKRCKTGLRSHVRLIPVSSSARCRRGQRKIVK